MSQEREAVAQYVREHVQFDRSGKSGKVISAAGKRFEKAFLLLPNEVLRLFLSGARNLTIVITPDPALPLGMSTKTQGPPNAREYKITVYDEHQEWPEDLFLGSFLRELGHVVAQRPPEDEWPTSRGDRARYKERLEYIADAMVWRWGLRHYSMRHLTATYPQHWVERIVVEIGKILLEESADRGLV
ncbi:MAG: hypothetical protein WBG50_01210 [Desulfomonilaceae bacterium]